MCIAKAIMTESVITVPSSATVQQCLATMFSQTSTRPHHFMTGLATIAQTAFEGASLAD